MTEDGNALSALPSSPAGGTNNPTLVQTSHLLADVPPLLSVAVWTCKKHAKPGTACLRGFLGDRPLPRQTSNTPIFLAAPWDAPSPCEEV